MELFKNISIIIVSYKSKNKVLKLIKKISSKFKIVIIENSEDRSLKEKVKLLKTFSQYFTMKKIPLFIMIIIIHTLN